MGVKFYPMGMKLYPYPTDTHTDSGSGERNSEAREEDDDVQNDYLTRYPNTYPTGRGLRPSLECHIGLDSGPHLTETRLSPVLLLTTRPKKH
jgi:hypothetical protein